MPDLSNPDLWIALLTLSAMEIVLGIDNIVFLSILVSKLPAEQRAATRRLGLAAALVMRLALLGTITWIMQLKEPLFWIGEHWFSGKDLILIGGGLFLLGKATHEIHNKLEGGGEEVDDVRRASSRGMVILQIMVIDAVFSLDSVITAVGMADQIWVMVVAMLIAVGVMMIAAGTISDFVERHPTVKVLALSFLLLIGVMLVADGFHQHVDKGYIYFAMGFALFVEALNIRRTRKLRPVDLRTPYEEPPAA
jgi:predicted tellurium resistance membrane protein TerC